MSPSKTFFLQVLDTRMLSATAMDDAIFWTNTDAHNNAF